MFMKFSIVPKFLGIYHQEETAKTELNYLRVLNFLYLNLLQRDGKFLSKAGLTFKQYLVLYIAGFNFKNFSNSKIPTGSKREWFSG